MTIRVEARLRRGAFTLDVAFTTRARVAGLFGPSGSGKSTVLDVIAGLARPETGLVEIDGRVLLDTARRVAVPVHRRGIGYVFQDSRLFPHLSVRRNLLYGRRLAARGPGRHGSLAEIVDLLGIGHLLDRRPATLSGGERQRVAIGRALLASPRLLLFDEPLAALDEARKAETLPYIERLRDELAVPVLYVSHQMGELERLAAEVVRLEGGRVVARGDPQDAGTGTDRVAPSSSFG